MVAAAASDLSAAQLEHLTRYRVAQYIRTGFVDGRRFLELVADGMDVVQKAQGDVHVVALAADGELLCSAVLRALPDGAGKMRMRDRDREMFPVERVHGVGVFDRLRLLPDLPVSQVRELGGFVKNTRLSPRSDGAVRGPVEIGVAIFRLLSGPLAMCVSALIGDLEPSVAKANLEYFGGRVVLVPGTLPIVPGDSYLAPRYERRDVQPFALLVNDSAPAADRLHAIEAALALTGTASLCQLLDLRRQPRPAGQSSLAPSDEATPLASASCSYGDLPMGSRRDLARVSDDLRHFAFLGNLSRGEATTLAAQLEAVSVEPGAMVVRRGEKVDALYLIASGDAIAQVDDSDGRRRTVGRLTAYDYFGEVGVLMQGPATATVIATSPLRLWRLERSDYSDFLGRLPEVGSHLLHTAVRRMYERVRPAQESLLGPAGPRTDLLRASTLRSPSISAVVR